MAQMKKNGDEAQEARPIISCAGCQHLSEKQVLRFENEAVEERVVCLKGHWRGSALLGSLLQHKGYWREKAEQCGDYVPFSAAPSLPRFATLWSSQGLGKAGGIARSPLSRGGLAGLPPSIRPRLE